MERGNIEPTSSEKINQTATAMGTNRLYNFIQHATPCTVTLFCQRKHRSAATKYASTK